MKLSSHHYLLTLSPSQSLFLFVISLYFFMSLIVSSGTDSVLENVDRGPLSTPHIENVSCEKSGSRAAVHHFVQLTVETSAATRNSIEDFKTFV